MERFLRIWLLLSFGLLTGCASLVHGPDRPPTSQQIVGVYDWGHRGSSETWELRGDGTFSRTLHPHFSDDPSVTFTGTWSLTGKDLHLVETSRLNGTAEDIRAEVFFYKRKPAFARVADIDSEKVREWWVFKRRGGS